MPFSADKPGKTIEISTADAEGRLVLADAHYARQLGATHLIEPPLTALASSSSATLTAVTFSTTMKHGLSWTRVSTRVKSSALPLARIAEMIQERHLD